MGKFEEELRAFLTANGMPFIDNTGSLETLDFSLTDVNIHFDVKEKKQHINIGKWQGATIPEEHLFILDDLAARKILLKSPRSFLLVRDCTRTPTLFVVFSIVDLLCMPKRRVRRKLERASESVKGKWYTDLRHGAAHGTLANAVTYMKLYPEQFPAIFKSHIDCWESYEGENILTAGSVRTQQYWDKDLHER